MTTQANPGFDQPASTFGAVPPAAGSTEELPSVGELVANVSRDLGELLHQEFELAKAELKREAVKTGKGAGMLGGSGFAGYMTLFFLSCALWWALANVMDAGWAALIVAVVWGAIGTVLFIAGRAQLRTVHPTPERTVETAKQVPSALRGEAS